MDYPAHWRMLLAADRLQNSSEPISIVAPSLGYNPDTSFNMAFKKIMGCSHRRYGRGEGPRFTKRSARLTELERRQHKQEMDPPLTYCSLPYNIVW